jgi:hypothetical protein
MTSRENGSYDDSGGARLEEREELEARADFCEQCGRARSVVCPACGDELADIASRSRQEYGR